VNDGKTAFIVNPKEAEIVRLVFEWYVGGMTIRGIQRELTRLGIPTPGDTYPAEHYHKLRGRGEWNRSTIAWMLKNESYAGSWYYGKRSPRTPNSKRTVANDPRTWIRVSVPEIIRRDLWQKVQRGLVKNLERGGNNVRHDYLLRGHVICEECGARISAQSVRKGDKHYSYYMCRWARVATPHPNHIYPSGAVDQIAWAWVKQLLLNPDAIVEGLAAYKREQESNAEPIAAHISTIEGLLIEKRAALQRLLDLYISGEFHRDMLIDKKADLEKTIAELEKEHAALVAGLRAQSISEEQERTLIDFARQISEGLETAETNFKTRRGVIEALGVEARLARQDGIKTIRVRCILGEGYYVLSPMIQEQ
jgi:hypothetical protein